MTLVCALISVTVISVVNGCDVTMRWEICPQTLLWTANFDEISVRSARPQISNQISRNPCLGQPKMTVSTVHDEVMTDGKVHDRN